MKLSNQTAIIEALTPVMGFEAARALALHAGTKPTSRVTRLIGTVGAEALRKFVVMP